MTSPDRARYLLANAKRDLCKHGVMPDHCAECAPDESEDDQ